MVSQQFAKEVSRDVPQDSALTQEALVFGAKMLKLAVAFDNLKLQGLSEEDALERLQTRSAEFGKEMLEALQTLAPDGAKLELRTISTNRLTAGMILQQEIRTESGMLVLAKGQEVTTALALKLENFAHSGKIEKEIMALVPIVPPGVLEIF